MLVAGFSDPVSPLVLPFWQPAMFKIHLKKGKLSSRFKCSALKMENGEEEIENWFLPSSRQGAEPGQERRLDCGKKQNCSSSVWRCGLGRAGPGPGAGSCE